MTLPSSPVVGIPALGSNLAAIPTSLMFDCETTAGAYTLTGGSTAIGIGSATLATYASVNPDNVLTLGGRFFVPVPFSASAGLDALTQVINTPIYIIQNGTDNTDGHVDDFLVAIITYLVYNAATKTLVAA